MIRGERNAPESVSETDSANAICNDNSGDCVINSYNSTGEFILECSAVLVSLYYIYQYGGCLAFESASQDHAENLRRYLIGTAVLICFGFASFYQASVVMGWSYQPICMVRILYPNDFNSVVELLCGIMYGKAGGL